MTEPAQAPPSPGRLPERPVLPGFHPDPTVCRVGDTFYLACSSFEYMPGVPLYRSADLSRWERIGAVMERPSQLAPGGVPPSGGVYAPTLRHRDGTFHLVTTDVSNGPGHLLMTASDPAGPWSDPVRVPDAGGIDPDLAWDEAGRCLLTWSDGAIRQAVLDPATGALLTEPRTLWSGTGGRDPEAPHLYRAGRWWYLVIAEGGTGPGHAVTVARGPSPSGPFEACPHNPLLTARGLPGPVQNTGHADLVERADGSWAAVFLGVRPRGSFPGWHVLGRETFAAEVEWRGGWPVLGAPIEPRERPVRPEPGPGEAGAGWVGAGVLPDRVLRRTRDHWRMTPGRDGPAFVGRRQEHTEAVVGAEIGARAGAGALEVRIDPRHRVALEVEGDRVRAVMDVGPVSAVLGECAAPPGTVLELRVEPPSAPPYSRERGPDVIVASVRTPDGGDTTLARVDGRYLSTEVAGGFTGRMVGVSCRSGAIEVRGLDYRGGA